MQSRKKFLVQVSGYLIDFEPPTPQLPLSSAPPSPATHLNIKRNHRKICEQDELSRSPPSGLNKARLECHKEPGWRMVRLSKKQKCIFCCEKCGTQSGAQIHNRSGRKSIFKCSVCDAVLCNRKSKTTVRVPNSTERQKQQTLTCERLWHSEEVNDWPKLRCTNPITPHMRNQCAHRRHLRLIPLNEAEMRIMTTKKRS